MGSSTRFSDIPFYPFAYHVNLYFDVQLVIPDLSIVTITYNNPAALQRTYESTAGLRAAGAVHLIQNGGKSLEFDWSDVDVKEEADNGIYDALNRGTSRVTSRYFMLIHSGDEFVGNLDDIGEIISDMNSNGVDLSLNACIIETETGSRMMSPRLWHPWMLRVGVQPPHTPTIYRTETLARLAYDQSIPISADFKHFRDIFRRGHHWAKHNKLLIGMEAGGATSSGLVSFWRVTKQMALIGGWHFALVTILARPILKLLFTR